MEFNYGIEFRRFCLLDKLRPHPAGAKKGRRRVGSPINRFVQYLQGRQVISNASATPRWLPVPATITGPSQVHPTDDGSFPFQSTDSAANIVAGMDGCAELRFATEVN